MKKRFFVLAILAAVTIGHISAQSWLATHDNSLVVYPDTTKVGIGTGSPTEKLHLLEGAIRLGRRTVPPFGLPTEWVDPCIKFGNGENIKIGLWGSYNATTLSFKAPKFNFVTGNVGIGVSNPQYKLDVNGTIRANEIIVNISSGADFVFGPNYMLRPLSEVGDYIAKHHHLPEIPSADDMEANGISVNDMQIQLLQKIEELTLYILQQEERIQQLETQIK